MQGGASLVDYDYDGLGRMTRLTRSNGRVTDYSYGPLSRLASLAHVGMVTNGFTWNPASQIATRTVSASAYRWSLAVDLSQSYARNTLNQYTSISGAGLTYDANGNLTGAPGAVTGSGGSSTFAYDAENRLTSATGAVSGTLTYDGLGRLLTSAGGGETAIRYLYDGDELAVEYNSAGTAILRRYVHGAGVDDPQVWYEGSGTSSPRFLHADERGSIVAVSNASGSVTDINTYDTWGVPAPDNVGRFQYTGQIWLPQLQLYQYKARMYAPHIGRFMQTDPIGYEDGMNLYTYVGNDPVNGVDPFGMYECSDRLSRSQCDQFEHAQTAAIEHLENRLATLESARSTLESGGELTDAEAAAVNDLTTFFGSEGSGVEGINTAISLGEAVLGELQSDKPVVLGTHSSPARVELGGRRLSLGSSFFSSSTGPYSQVHLLAHEASHSSGIAPRDIGLRLNSGEFIGPYGIQAAINRARYAPSLTIRHADSIPYALGFRRSRR